MADPAPAERHPDPRVASARYLRLVDEGVLGPDDRVELLEGVIVAMAPHSPRHAVGVALATNALSAAVGKRAAVRAQLPVHIGPYAVPEPDVAVVAGRQSEYLTADPTTALLVVEVSDSSLVQDRLTKGPLYAAGGIPEYWIVNLCDDRVEVFRAPMQDERRYAEATTAERGDRLELIGLPGTYVAVAELLPAYPASD